MIVFISKRNNPVKIIFSVIIILSYISNRIRMASDFLKSRVSRPCRPGRFVSFHWQALMNLL